MKIKLNIVIFGAMLCLGACKGNAQHAEPLHPIVQKAKETSLYADRVSWEEVNARFLELTKGKQSVDELKDGLQYLINSLGDKHAQVRSTKDYSIVVSYTGEIAEENGVERNSNFVNTVINDVSAQFTYKLLPDKIGYLKVVGIGPGNVKEQSDFIRNGLKDLKEKGVDKWIVDLRFNGGGNMEPMISGLAPLIGEGKIGGAANYRNEMTRQYKIENGQFNNNGRIACEMDDLPKIKTTEKVAVLLSRYTISSGEMVAVAFKGRDHTRFIGEETAGYTTGNGFDPINNEIVLIISQDVFADRNNNIYDQKVGVDEHLEFQHDVPLENDLQLNRAVEWLKE
ncbi:S41 family peptidase [Maribacter algicola]|uniref:S41 family peptidase n=1 Tax=Meishania litoralis TaxID=3434685 RepID=A0ACC7LJP9_9FLAO